VSCTGRDKRVCKVARCEQPFLSVEELVVGADRDRHELLAVPVRAFAEERHGVDVSEAEASSRRSDSDVTAPDPC
jgi:hypothetical protein